MSGIEVAGLVLGAIPLVISALEHYKEGKGLVATVLKFRGLLDDLIHQLKLQRTFFYMDIRQLLQEARVAEMADEIDPTEERCASILHNAKTGTEVKLYLGHLYSPFLEILERYERCLKTVAGKLGHIIRPVNAAKDDLAAIIQANTTTNTSQVIHGRLKFSIERASLLALLEDLRTERFSLKTIIKGMKTQREYEAREPSRQARKLAQVFTQIQASAMSLFTAMCQSCECQCCSMHKVLIRLDNRVSNRRERSQLSMKSKQDVFFNLFLPVDDSIFQETVVNARAVEPTEVYLNPSRTDDPESRKVSVKRPAIRVTTTTCPDPITRIRITNICESAREARCQGQILALELAADVLELIEEVAESKTSFTAAITLADFLRDTSQDEDARMTPKQQTLLALDVASSILQLRETLWCSIPWNNMAIKFLIQQRETSSVTVCTPFVEQAIHTELAMKRHVSADSDTKAALLELAILLLEIWNHKSIEAWAEKTGIENPEKPEARMRAAIRWLELTSDRLPTHYLNAVEQCLAMCSGRLRFWHDNEFQRLYCENIIKPLQESCRAW